eukprot:5367703-Prymnesium_polylepis.1
MSRLDCTRPAVTKKMSGSGRNAFHPSNVVVDKRARNTTHSSLPSRTRVRSRGAGGSSNAGQRGLQLFLVVRLELGLIFGARH